MGNEKKRELTTRDVVRIVRKEIIANRNETTALRAEIAVMRTELSGIHKVMEENKLFIHSMALSLKAVREVVVRAGEGLDSFFVDMREAAKELVPAMAEMRQGPVATKNTYPEFDEEEVMDDEPENESTNDDDDGIEETYTTKESPKCTAYHVTNENREVECCLVKGHKGDHLFKCGSKTCPGYSWAATKDMPHPMTTCGETSDDKKA